VRASVWFGAFALYAAVPWSGRSLALALTAGLAALLLNLLISGGISFPSVAQPMWVVAALALAAAADRKPGVEGERAAAGRSALRSLGPLPVFLAASIAFFLLAFSPVVTCARHRADFFHARVLFRLARQQKGDAAAETFIQPAARPLDLAINADPTDTAPLTDKAAWCLELAEFFRTARQENRSDQFRGLRYSEPALEAAEAGPTARPARPRGRSCKRSTSTFALPSRSRRNATSTSRQRKPSSRISSRCVPPTPPGCTTTWQVPRQVKNDDAKKRHAQEALDLDRDAPRPGVQTH
jgi:hypothetical protein